MAFHNRKLFGTAFIAAATISPAMSATIVTFDEFGSGTQDRFPQQPKLNASLVMIGNLQVLAYHLPFSFTNGDVFLKEPGGGPNSDLLRFINGNDIFVFSDNRETEGAAADVGVPTSSPPNFPVLTFTEVGNEGRNGFNYTPANGQPGFPDFAVTYRFMSDSPKPVPEPALPPMLALALGGVALARSLRPFATECMNRRRRGDRPKLRAWDRICCKQRDRSVR